MDLQVGIIEQATLPSALEKVFIQAVQIRSVKGVHLKASN